jgi:ribosome-associated protein
MEPQELKKRNFESELSYTSSRGSGPGGQNINKLNTRIELRFNITNSAILSDEEKKLVMKRLSRRINKLGDFVIFAGEERSQLMNKRLVTEKFFMLLAKALSTQPERKATKPTTGSVRKRLETKHNNAVKKKLRKTLPDNSEE